MPIDFKKEQKDLYQPKTTPSIIDVPEMIFIAIDGKGDPNTSAEYSAAIEVLYGVSWTIKMSNKQILEYVVSPLEALWDVDDNAFKGVGQEITDKGKFSWTVLIRQPDFMTDEVFETAMSVLVKKKPRREKGGLRQGVFKELKQYETVL